jgi:hypothetical protein
LHTVADNRVRLPSHDNWAINPGIGIVEWGMRRVFALAVVFGTTFGVTAAEAAAKIKVNYSLVYDRIRPEPQKNVQVRQNFEVALDESGSVSEHLVRSAGRFSDQFKRGSKLGGGLWEVVSESELRRTFDQPQSVLTITIKTQDKSCGVDVKWTLKPGFNEYKFRRITDGTFAFFTEPKLQSTNCSIQ